jgi:ADP-heptose:LPS heptosyltransferase
MKKIYKFFLIFFASRQAKKRRGAANKHLLLCKYDKLGDFFIFIPHLQELLQRGYRITLVAPKMLEAIVQFHKLELQFIASETKTIAQIKKTLSRVRENKYEAAINFSMNVWGGVFANQADANVKIGLVQETEHYVYKGADLFYDLRLRFTPTPLTIDTYTMAIGKAIEGFKIEYNIDVATSKTTIVIHPFANWQPREWPYFAELVEMLVESGEVVEIIGTAAEFSRADWAKDLKENTKLKLSKLRSISELLKRISAAKLFIGNDSGPAHYAALIGKASFVLWGPGNFDRIHPVGSDVTIFKKDIECRPCRQVGALCQRGSNDCLKQIELAEVFTAIEKRIEK